MSRLNRCLAGDVDSIEMYILPEAGDERNGSGYSSTLDTKVGENSETCRDSRDEVDFMRTDIITGVAGLVESRYPGKKGSHSEEKGVVAAPEGQLEDAGDRMKEEGEPAYWEYCGIRVLRFTGTSFRVLLVMILSAAAFVQVMHCYLNSQVDSVISKL
jgi:hypothetical protein